MKSWNKTHKHNLRCHAGHASGWLDPSHCFQWYSGCALCSISKRNTIWFLPGFARCEVFHLNKFTLYLLYNLLDSKWNISVFLLKFQYHYSTYIFTVIRSPLPIDAHSWPFFIPNHAAKPRQVLRKTAPAKAPKEGVKTTDLFEPACCPLH